LVSWSGSCCSSLSLSLPRPQTEPRGKLSLETAPDLVWPLVSARGRGCAKAFFWGYGYLHTEEPIKSLFSPLSWHCSHYRAPLLYPTKSYSAHVILDLPPHLRFSGLLFTILDSEFHTKIRPFKALVQLFNFSFLCQLPATLPATLSGAPRPRGSCRRLAYSHAHYQIQALPLPPQAYF
jgi:hypothetical protein